jgi:hypothetical protein
VRIKFQTAEQTDALIQRTKDSLVWTRQRRTIDGTSKAAIGVRNILAANFPPEVDTAVIKIALDKFGVIHDIKDK